MGAALKVPATAAAAEVAAGSSRRSNLSTLAYEALRERVRRGLISPDDRLVDTEIANQLAVSRMPVREALLQLVAEGVLGLICRCRR